MISFTPVPEQDMHLTQHTDYSLRVLIHLALHPDHLVTISEMAEFYGISRNHLVKVVHHLAKNDFVATVQGKNGGVRLAREPERVSIGAVVRCSEPNFHLVECFDPQKNRCAVTEVCTLGGILARAKAGFLAELDRYSLADAVQEGLPQRVNFRNGGLSG